LARAEDRLRAQAEILSDAVHGVHDVVADFEIGERDGDAFLDGAQLDAFGRLPVDLAVAEHVQAQAGNREARLDVALIDEHDAALGHAGRRAHERRRAVLPEVQHRRAAFDGQVRGAQHLGQPRRARGDQGDRLAVRHPGLDLVEKHRQLPVEVFDRPRLQHERLERARQPRRRFAFDCARHDQRAARRKRGSEVIERRMRGEHVREQGFADRILVDAEFARLHGREEHVLFAGAFVFETALDRREQGRLFEDHDPVVAEVVQQRFAFVVRERKPRLGDIRAAREERAGGRDRGGRAFDLREDPGAQPVVARNLAPRDHVERVEGARAPLRRKVERADRFDLVAEELDACGRVGARGPHVHDAAANGVFAGGRDHVRAVIAEFEEFLLSRFEPGVLTRREGEP